MTDKASVRWLPLFVATESVIKAVRKAAAKVAVKR